MKSRIFFLVSAIILSVHTSLLATEIDSLLNQKANKITVWNTDYINGEWCLIRSNCLDSIPHEIVTLIAEWNKCHIAQLSFLKTNADTAYIEIEPENLFSQLGTTGSERIIAEIVFTITEDNKYPNVFLRFDDTEHASSGLYCRQYFRDKFSIKPFCKR